jgi:SAM-dependent methyltransferase
MTQHDWNANYASNELPWDTGAPDPFLVEAIEAEIVPRGRALDIGCGTGTNALWLAAKGFDVLGLDLAPLAIERAKAKAKAVTPAPQCRFEARDFLADELPPPGFQLIFDRGCFHVFDKREQQAEFAARVARLLAPDGVWLSLIGSTEGPAREMGPPRRNAREIVGAIEPSLQLVGLRAIEFEAIPGAKTPPKAWLCVASRREQPAQPSTRW